MVRPLSLLATGLASLALAACAATPSGDDAADDADGKADGISVISKRRRLAYSVRCHADDSPFAVAFFDADSTLRVSKSGSVSANSPTDVNVLPFAAKELARLAGEGYLIAVVSNQGGVAAHQITYETAEKGLANVIAKLRKLGAPVHYFDFAEANNEFRKPKIGMAELLDEKLVNKCDVGIDLTKSFMVGDSGYKEGVDGPHPDGRPADDFSSSDRLFAENLGVPFHEPTDFFRWRDYEVFNIASQDELLSFLDAIDARALDLEATDPEAAEALADEASRNREVNEL